MQQTSVGYHQSSLSARLPQLLPSLAKYNNNPFLVTVTNLTRVLGTLTWNSVWNSSVSNCTKTIKSNSFKVLYSGSRLRSDIVGQKINRGDVLVKLLIISMSLKHSKYKLLHCGLQTDLRKVILPTCFSPETKIDKFGKLFL